MIKNNRRGNFPIIRQSVLKSASYLPLLISGLVLGGCNSGGTTTIVTTPCYAPTFSQQLAESLLIAWGNGLESYNSANNADIYLSAGYFTMNFYTPEAILLPTVSASQRVGTNNIYDYFTHFLAGNPQMSLPNPESNIAGGLGCGYGSYSGYYNFKVNPGTPQESTVEARFTFIYQYMPVPFLNSFNVESGPQQGAIITQTSPAGWYINTQQSSKLPVYQ